MADPTHVGAMPADRDVDPSTLDYFQADLADAHAAQAACRHAWAAHSTAAISR